MAGKKYSGVEHGRGAFLPSFKRHSLSTIYYCILYTPLFFIFRQEVEDGKPERSKNSSEVEKYENWLKKQLFLREKMRQTCLNYGDSAKVTLQQKHFIYDSVHKLLFCRNAKVTFYLHFNSIILVWGNKRIMKPRLSCGELISA